MKKTAFIFPGQGAQYVGMAIDFIEKQPDYLQYLIDFEHKTGINLYNIMKQGPEELLKETPFTQPAILFHSIIAWKTFSERIDLKPDFVAGHSLGEFSALVVNGVLDFQAALYLVHKRGHFMIKANEGKPYAMSAIIGLTPEEVLTICTEASKTDIVIAANFNTPVQTVISGSQKGVEKAVKLAIEAGAKRTVPLTVGGPFHSPLMEKASLWLSAEMSKMNFRDADIPLISNVNARPERNPEKIKQNLSRQVTSSVLWLDTINYLISEKVEQFIEFGPRNVLAGMLKKIDRKISVYSIDKYEDIGAIIEILEKQ
ncbi:MAG: malonyl-CoA-ACP transacylase [Candidatus Cloacimonas sp. SDB]|nr:MAG: malonyl-CoA-ACP transacylase [Candidatus Cloacimonas sp. SDB]